MTRALRTLLFVFVAAAIATPIAVAIWPLVAPRNAHPAADFTLLDQNGAPFALSAQRGKAVVLFFGYTHCPDVCPATLAALAKAYRGLGSPPDLRVAFITVDPNRDSQSALKAYVGLFDPHFVGLTGDPKTLKSVFTSYGVYAEVDPDASSALGYTVTHSAGVYLIDKDGNLRTTLDWNATPTEFAAALRKLAA
jgi:protein SCO1/2